MRQNRSRHRRGVAVLAVLALGAATGLAACSDDDDVSTGDDTTSTTSTSSTTSSSSSAPSSTDLAGAQPETAVFPDATTSRRFDDPVAAARAFAVDYLGFVDPVVGEFAQGDSRSGEVDVQPQANGPATTVLVRQLGPDDSWWVLGAATSNLRLDEPEALATVSSPLSLSGTSTAFEGTVDVQLRSDRASEPLARGFATGGANGEFGPFTTELEFGDPGAEGGAVVLSTSSMEDGRIWEASVVRVRFG